MRNNHAIRLSYYFNIETIDIPLYGLLYLSIIIGIIMGMLVRISTGFSLKRMVNALDSENRELKQKAAEEKEEN